jgi:DNA invertase Pin-like site-specific DNA recombinase
MDHGSKLKEFSDNLAKVVRDKKGKSGPLTSLINKIEFECNKGHKWMETAKKVIGGSWCNICKPSDGENFYFILETIFQKLGFETARKWVSDDTPDLLAELFCTDGELEIIVEIDNEKDLLKPSYRDIIKKNIENIILEDKRIIRINSDFFEKGDIKPFIEKAIKSDEDINISSPELYNWLFEETKPIIPIVPEIDDLPPDAPIAIPYLRVSTLMQALNGSSLDAQETNIRMYCKRNGYRVGKIYKDEGISGKNIKSRPGILQLLAELKPGNKVIVVSVSRLARDTEETLALVRIIREEKKASLVIMDMNIDTSTTTGEFFLTVMAGLSHFERKNIRDKIRDTMSVMSIKGTLRGKAPFGKKFVGKKLPFEDDPREIAIIDFMRKTKEEHPDYTVSEICRCLEKAGHQPRKADAKWWPATVTRIMVHQGIIKDEKK